MKKKSKRKIKALSKRKVVKKKKRNPTNENLIKKLKIDKEIISRKFINYRVYLYDELVAFGAMTINNNFMDEFVVAEKFRRKGVATFLYDYIEKDLGIRLRPNDIRTDSHEAFWKTR